MPDIDLTPLAEGHVAALADLVKDRAVRAFLGAGRNENEFKAGVLREIERFDRDGWGLFAITRSEDGSFLGCCGFVPCTAAGCDGPELVCAVRSEIRGAGIGTIACRQALDWGFRQQRWPCIYASISQSNERVHGFASELGMTPIGERADLFDVAQTIYRLENPAAAP